jgi:hypothetical protein
MEVPLTLVSLSKLASSPLERSSLNSTESFQGYVFRAPRYDLRDQSCTINLVSRKPNRAVAVVEVKGEAGKRINNRVKEGDKVCFRGEGSKLSRVTDDGAGPPCVRVVFEGGISGWIQRKGSHDDYFSFGKLFLSPLV